MTNYQLPHISPTDAVAALQSGIILLDVRKADARDERTVATATWYDPMAFDHAVAATLAKPETLIFCVHGHEVSQFVCALARIHGVNARYVVGGYEALVAAGAATQVIE